MSILQPLEKQPGFLRGGFLGFGASGKTYTAVMLAIAVRKRFEDKRPIAFYDTEKGLEYLREIVEQLTGVPPLHIASRNFDDLVAAHTEAAEAASVFVADSITHPWREICTAYLDAMNAKRIALNKMPRTNLTLKDWNVLKEKWNGEWAQPFLNRPVHTIICGRAGYTFDMVQDDAGDEELRKTGVRMKTETEFGYEPGLLVFMDRVQELSADPMKPTTTLGRRATVLKDRFARIDGHMELFPNQDPEQALAAVEQFFWPHIDALVPTDHGRIDTTGSEVAVTGGDAQWVAEQKERTILLEEIKDDLLEVWPAATGKDKEAKVKALRQAFDTSSWTAIEGLSSEILRAGRKKIRQLANAAADAKMVAANGKGKKK